MNFVSKTLTNVLQISAICIVWEENGKILKGHHIWDYLGDDGKKEFNTGLYLYQRGLKVPTYFEYYQSDYLNVFSMEKVDLLVNLLKPEIKV